MRPLEVVSRIADVRLDTDPASVASALDRFWRDDPSDPEAKRIQFCEPLPGALLAALSEALRTRPDRELRVYGRDLDPSLSFLRGFEHVRRLSIDMWLVDSFEPLAEFRELSSLSLGETKSKRLSLEVLRRFPKLKDLYIPGHLKGLEAVRDLPALRHLSLATPAKSLDALRDHPSLKSLWLFRGPRDLGPLESLPELRDLSVFAVRLFESADLAPIGRVPNLRALGLQDLPHVHSLEPLGESKIEFLQLAGLRNLESLTTLRAWPRLKGVRLSDARPQDRRLSVICACPALRSVWVGDSYESAEIAAFLRDFRGAYFWWRGDVLRGDQGAADALGFEPRLLPMM